MIAIRMEFPDAKLIILTTYESDVQVATKLGARAYLLKALSILTLGPITYKAVEMYLTFATYGVPNRMTTYYDPAA